MHNLGAVVNVMGPVLLVAVSGYAFARIRPPNLSGLTDALFFVFVPALVFSSMSRSSLSPAVMGEIALCATVVCLGSAALAWLTLRARGRSSPGFVLVSTFANNANMGISLCALAFGDEGTALATAYYVVTATLTFSFGISMVAPAGRRFEMLRVPLLYAAALGLATRFLGLQLPTAVATGVGLLGQAAIPTMLFSLGCRLATVSVSGLGLATQAAAVRLGGGFAIGLALTQLLDIAGVARSVIVLQAAMPAAVINFVIAEKYRSDAQLVAAAITVSTLLSILTLPALLAYLM